MARTGASAMPPVVPLGFWESLDGGALGPLASVDWCESNYVWSEWIAEWWNTLSSLLIVVAAVAGLGYLRRQRRRGGVVEGRFVLAYVVVALVGLGSVAFHATLLKYPQAADELPMIYAGLVFAYVRLPTICHRSRGLNALEQPNINWESLRAFGSGGGRCVHGLDAPALGSSLAGRGTA